MAKKDRTSPRTDVQIRDLATPAKIEFHGFGEGLFLFAYPNGSKLWRGNYRKPDGKRSWIGLGKAGELSIKAARAKLHQRIEDIKAGNDPVLERPGSPADTADTFKAVAYRWHAKKSKAWSPAYSKKTIENLVRNAFRALGARPIASITRKEFKAVLESVNANGEAHKLRQIAGAVFQYAIDVEELMETNPAANMREALSPKKVAHYPTITEPHKIGPLLRAIDGYTGSKVVRYALKILPLVFTRPGELRKAQWVHFHLSGREPQWTIPSELMKTRKEHRVPLSRQAVSLLRELHQVTGDGPILFPQPRKKGNPISDNTLNAALRGLGYTKEQIVAHGFRSMASTLLHERGWDHQAIELQLAHEQRSEVAAAYNHASLMPMRRNMMQAWADFLDQLRAGEGSDVRMNVSFAMTFPKSQAP